MLDRINKLNVLLLAMWSAICALASQMHFPHFLFICETVEAVYGHLANDAVVLRVMQAIVGMLWLLGILAFIAAGAVFRLTLTRRESRPCA
jgi:hypothetical protein